MPVETAADRALFVDPDEFGTAAAWTLAAGGDPVTVDGIFDADYQLLGVAFDEAGQEGAQPRFLCRSADLPAGAGQGDTLTIGAAGYDVVELKPDGTGMTEARLQESG